MAGSRSAGRSAGTAAMPSFNARSSPGTSIVCSNGRLPVQPEHVTRLGHLSLGWQRLAEFTDAPFKVRDDQLLVRKHRLEHGNLGLLERLARPCCSLSGIAPLVKKSVTH